jgi:predicted polyphosphate/ATP-dependent NAD kinase
MLNIGLIINPLAGLGGSLGMKGSDGDEMRDIAADMSENERRRSRDRAARALGRLVGVDGVQLLTCPGAMGEGVCAALGFEHRVFDPVGEASPGAEHTRHYARAMLDDGADLLVFAGGDGTARDIFDVVGENLPVLGIPAGVKMHSGVFAVSPEAAGDLLVELARGGLVGLRHQEVRDIDEDAFREDVVRSRFYGDMLVPGEGRYLQHTKIGGRESQELVAGEIAAWVAEQMTEGILYLIGPGSTTAAIMEQLALDNTLLGVDVVRNNELLRADANEADLLGLLQQYPGPARIYVTAIGGQGHIFGRGNQQFSPAVIRTVGTANIRIVAAKSKITSLEGRPLLVDTNDPQLDEELSGYRKVITGYDDRILYAVASNDQETL